MIPVFPDFHVNDIFLLGAFFSATTSISLVNIYPSWGFWNSVPSLMPFQIAATCSDAPCLLPFLWEPCHPFYFLDLTLLPSALGFLLFLLSLKASEWHFSAGTIYKPFSGAQDYCPCYTTAWWVKMLGFVGLWHSDHKRWSGPIPKMT